MSHFGHPPNVQLNRPAPNAVFTRDSNNPFGRAQLGAKYLVSFSSHSLTKREKIIQGVRGQSGFFNLALRDRNIQVRLCLKVVLKY